MELTAELQRLSGTTLSAQGAANAWAGTTGLSLQGALNAKAGTTGLGIQGALNSIAGTTGLGVNGSSSSISASTTWTSTVVSRHRGPFASVNLAATVGGTAMVSTNTGTLPYEQNQIVTNDGIAGLVARGTRSKTLLTLPTPVPLKPSGSYTYRAWLFRRLTVDAGTGATAVGLGGFLASGSSTSGADVNLYAQLVNAQTQLKFIPSYHGDVGVTLSAPNSQTSMSYSYGGYGSLTSALGSGWHVVVLGLSGNVGKLWLDGAAIVSNMDTTALAAGNCTTVSFDSFSTFSAGFRGNVFLYDHVVGTGASEAQVEQMQTDLLATVPTS
jgi:hypothetical protein